MTNKQQINRLRDNAELAWAAYGFFHLVNGNFDKDILEKIKRKENPTITYQDVLNVKYKNCKVIGLDRWGEEEPIGTLDGDFTPTQAKNFFERYDILIHQPNTHSGFSATLFQDRESKEYTLAIRGTEIFTRDMFITDLQLLSGTLPNQYLDMLLFYYQCIGKIPFYVTSESKPKGEDTSFICDKLDIKCSHSVEYKLWEKIYIQSTQAEYKPYIAESLLKDSTLPPTSSNFTPPITATTKLTLTGHSLGGCLAQLFALSFSKDLSKDFKPKDSNASATEANQDSIINAVYTVNSPGAKNLKLYDIILSIPNTINESIQQHLLTAYTKRLQDKAQELKINTHDLDTQINLTLKEIIYNTNNANTHFGISLLSRSGNPSIGLEYVNIAYEAIHYELLTAYQTLTHNYNNRNKEGYKLSISDRIFHIESQNKFDEKHHANESIKENATQHLGKDIEGNYFLLNLNFGGLDSHRITSMAKILYFYAYLYEVNETLIDTTSKEAKTEYELHKDEFLKEHSEIDTKEYRECKKALEYCNTIALAVHKILENRKAEKTQYSDIYKFKEPPNWLYAIIEQRLFEAQIKTKETKFPLQEDTSNIIEAILYLQEKGVYIQIL